MKTIIDVEVVLAWPEGPGFAVVLVYLDGSREALGMTEVAWRQLSAGMAKIGF